MCLSKYYPIPNPSQTVIISYPRQQVSYKSITGGLKVTSRPESIAESIGMFDLEEGLIPLAHDLSPGYNDGIGANSYN